MFTNYHLAITKEAFQNREYQLNPALSINEITDRKFERYIKLLKAVGGPWGWDRRPKYYADPQGLKNRVEEGRLHLLKHFKAVTGYCLSIERKDLTTTFNKKAVAEIENFGLLLQHTGKGYGPTYLALMFNELFKNHDLVYLSTRSTNHPKVIPFYQSMGMEIVKTERLDDDLRNEPQEWHLE